MKNKLSYLISKLILYVQIPSIKDSQINKKSWVGHRSNLDKVFMDKYSYCGVNCTLVDVTIGKYTSIASYCSIGGDNHPIDFVSTSQHLYRNNNVKKELNKSVEIGHDVWVGEKVFVKNGVKIGNGAIIGAHAVVTKDVPPYAIVVGTPAKIIKYRFNDEIINHLQKSEWWNYEHSIILENIDFIDQPVEFLHRLEQVK